MIHGYSLRSTGELYAPLYRYLNEAFTIYALDTRGHGASAHLVDGWTFKQMADDIAAAVANWGLKDALHIGHSYGGFMGLVTELHHPGTFRALNLLAPAAASGGAATPDEVKAAISRNGRDRVFMGGVFQGMYRSAPTQEQLGLVLDAVTLMDLRVHETYCWHEYAAINIVDRLHEITLPVLSVTGAKDVVVSPQEQRATCAALPRCKEVSFSDEGHMLPLESPERAAREVIRFANDIA
jgi:pimeloyl-ACP methyl ester carboxylesterase